MSRKKIFAIERPAALPYSCVVCGKSNPKSSDFWVDLGVSMQKHGALYLCLQCAQQVGEALSWIPKDEADDLREKLIDSLDRQVELKKAVESYGHVISDLSDAASIFGGLGVLSGVDSEMESAGTSD